MHAVASQPPSLFYLPFRPALDANGIVAPGARLFFFLTQTSIPQKIYADAALTIELENPVGANAAGVWPSIYMDPALTYRVVLKDQDGVTLNEVDPYRPGVAGEGEKGDTGPANSTYTTLAGLKAAAVSNASYIFAPPSGSDGGAAAGTFLYQTAGAPYTADGVNIIKLDAVPLSTGALVRQDLGQIGYQQQPAPSASNAASPVYAPSLILRETTSMERWWKPGDGDWYNASRRASLESAETGVPIKGRNRDYPGARLEFHARSSGFEANGARIDYFGVGNTLVAGIRPDGAPDGTTSQYTAWPTSDTDAMADRYPVLMYSVTEYSRTALRLNTVVGLSVGDWVHICQDPAANSSTFNLISQNFEWVQIQSFDGNVIRFNGRLRRIYDTNARVFMTKGVAVNCTIRDVTTTTTYDAYQHVVRSAINLRIENASFEGNAGVGAGTFQQNVTYTNARATGSYGSLSTARQSDQVLIDGFEWIPRVAPPAAEPFGLFFEESPGLVTAKNINLQGGGILFGSIRNPLAQGNRLIQISDININMDASPRLSHPIAMGSCEGVSVLIDGGKVRGQVSQPDPNQFPNTPACMVPLATNMPGDVVRIRNIDFVSTTTGAAIAIGGGFQGTAVVDVDSCTFTGCNPPPTLLRQNRVKSGTVTVTANDYADVVFDSIMPGLFTITLTPKSPVATYYNNEGQVGFRLHAPNGTTVSWKVEAVQGK